MTVDYIARFDSPYMEKYKQIYQSSPKWDGKSSLSDKTVIIYCEQGYGDIINFCRFIPLLKEKGCKIVLHCPSKLERLFYQLKIDGFVPKTSDELPEHDLHIPLMSIPYLLNFPDIQHFKFEVDPADLGEFENKLKIGIAWEGNPKHERNLIRSCKLKEFRPLFDLQDVAIFSLQKDVISPELVEGCEDLNLLSIELDDFQDTARLIQAMDLVVSVDTSVVHLAGSLDKKAFVLLDYDHDIRWVIKKWYKSLVFLRQSSQNNWTPLVQAVIKRIGN